MTHDQECTFDPKFCSMCKLQAEARADERAKYIHVCPDNNCCMGEPE